MAGQVGLFIGPVLAGNLIDAYGQIGFLGLPLMAAGAFLLALAWLVNVPSTLSSHAPAGTQQQAGRSFSIPWRTVVPLVVVIFSTSTVSFSILNFLPKLFIEQGYTLSYAGWTAGLYMLGSAAGGLVGGALADRVGSKPVILIGLLGMILPVLLYVPAGDPWRFLLLLLAGFFGGMPHSILVLLVQSLMPTQRAFASGITLGFMFFSGAVGAFFVGLVADQIGLAVALAAVAVLPLIAFFAALLLPRNVGASS